MTTTKKNIRQLRLAQDLTLQDVATVVGVTAQSVWLWEFKRVRPNKERLQKIADYFGVSVDELDVAPRRQPSWNGEGEVPGL